MTDTIDITPTWDAVLVTIVPALLTNGNRDSYDGGIAALKDAARKLDLLSRFIDSDDRALRMFQEFQQQEAAR